MIGIYKTAERRKRVCDVFGREITPLGNPTGKEIVIGNEVPDILLDTLNSCIWMRMVLLEARSRVIRKF